MVRIAITQAAFEAIAKTLPLGSVGYENKVNEKGERLIWLDRGGGRSAAFPCAGRARATATSSSRWRRAVVASTSGLGGERCRAPFGPAIPDEAKAREAEQQHCPG